MAQNTIAEALAAQRAGELERAAKLCREFLKRQPHSFEALYLLGFVLAQLNRPEEAERLIGQAIAINRHSPDAQYNRGCLLLRMDRLAEAVTCFDNALAIRPGYIDALLNRGFAYLRSRHPEAALADFNAVLSQVRNHVPALTGLGGTLCALHKEEDALVIFGRALDGDRNSHMAMAGRGTTLMRLGRYIEAVSQFDLLLAQQPNSPETLSNRATALLELRRIDEALHDYEKAALLAPTLPNLVGQLAYCKLHACDWIGLTEARRTIAAGLQNNRQVVVPFINLALSSSEEEQLRCARVWAVAEGTVEDSTLIREVHDRPRLRIAYLSADFSAHATAHLTASMFESHDRERFETIAVSYGPNDDSELRTRLESAFDDFLDVRTRSDTEIASLIRDLDINIAIDLKGLTKDSRNVILALRPAPIQVHFLGYPGTTAVPCIDYLLADKIVVPDEHRHFYTEAVVYLPFTYQPNAPAHMLLPTAKSRAEYGLPEDGFVFCCFNNNFKILPEMFAIWTRLLAQIEHSVLWLMADNPVALRNLRRAAIDQGIDPNRLIFATRAGLADHLARQRAADLFLDTLPYGAHTTASDALRAGVPVLTCLGNSFQGRVAASLLHAIGLPELVCRSLDDYEQSALKLARDHQYLRTIKDRLATNRCTHPLFDTARFTRNLEHAYLTMWDRAKQGLRPSSFEILDSNPSNQGFV